MFMSNLYVFGRTLEIVVISLPVMSVFTSGDVSQMQDTCVVPYLDIVFLSSCDTTPLIDSL